MPSHRRDLSRTRPRLLGVVVVVTLVACLGGSLSLSARAAGDGRVAGGTLERAVGQRASLVASPSRAIAGEKVTLRGRVPAGGSRSVQLQRRGPDGWVAAGRGTATRTGLFRLTTTARATTTTYRVRTSGARPFTTSARRVVAMDQSADLTVAAASTVGTRVEASASMAPAREGRPVELQRQVDGAWVTTASGVEDSSGQVRLVDTLVNPGARTYRIVAPRWGRVAAVTSAPRAVSVTAATTPPAVPELPSVADVAVTSTSPSSVLVRWTNPAALGYAGVLIRRAEGSTPPATPASGEFVAEVTQGSTWSDTGLDAATQYSYALFAYDSVTRYADAATSTTTTVDVSDVAPAATVTASSSAAGSSLAEVVQAGPEDADRGWRTTTETTGAWLNLAWSQPQTLHRLVLTRPAGSRPGIASGTLSFDDGSPIQVLLSPTSTQTVVAFAPRSVRSVRFTVATVSAGATGAALTRVVAGGAASPDLGDNVATGAPADGDVAATASLSTSASGGDPGTLVDGGSGGTGATWTVASPSQSWVQLDWARPRELTAISVAGAPSAAALRSAVVTFSDGSTITLGAVLADPTRPTIVGFMPRVTTSVRVTFDGIGGSGPLTLSELSAYQRGAPALRTPGGAQAPWTDHPVDCSSTSRPSDATGLVVLCPTNGTSVGATGTLTVGLGASYTSVRATPWPGQASAPVPTAVSATPGGNGVARLALDTSALAPGPFTVELVATSPTASPRTVYLQLYRVGVQPTPAAGAQRGRTLVYSEEFDRPLALSRTGAGADYATAKPERTYGADFGDAIFADPGDGLGNVRVVDKQYLKISSQPNPADYADPRGWGRTRVGGMLASARPGGSGFSAQYGYFESRMLLPAGVGSWPAFWILPSANLAKALPVVAEIDALEYYGHNPTGACHTSHQYPDPGRVGVARCGTRWPNARAALAWHTFGVSVEPTVLRYYIDGVEVASAPQVAGGDEPLFWLVNLAMGGGYPVQLEGTQDRLDLYVDYVRVYV